MKNIFILTAQIKELKGSSLVARHYYLTPGSASEANQVIDEFKAETQKDSREILDMLAYVLTEEDIKKAIE